MGKTKLAVVVRDDLATWQRLNVATFVVSGIGTRHPEVIGENYQDASGTEYLAKFGLPVLVYEAGGDEIRAAHRSAVDRGLTVGVYIEEMFLTGNDLDNRAAVAAVPTDKLALVGIAVYGGRNAVDKALKGLRLHP
jgi:hypothetical protein